MDQEQTPSTNSQPPASPQDHPAIHSFPKKDMKHGGIVAGIIILLLAGGLTFALWNSKQASNNSIINTDNQSSITDGNSSAADEGINSYPTTTPGSVVDPNSYSCNKPLAPVASKSGLVQWNNLQSLGDLKLFKEDSSETSDSYYYYVSYYKVGKFIDGQYKGGDIILAAATPNGPSGHPDYYRFVHFGNKYILLAQYSDYSKDNTFDTGLLVSDIDKNFSLSDLEFPQSLSLDSPKASFSYSSSAGFFMNAHELFCADNYVKVFTDVNVGDVYTDATTSITDSMGRVASSFNGFYVKSPDGVKVVYSLDIPIVGEGDVPLVTWSNGKTNTEEYSYKAVGGCGSTNFRDVADISPDKLVQIGSDFFGQPVFGFKDPQIQELQDKYKDMYVPEGQQKIYYNNFVAAHPIFFWKDSFGKFVRFTTKKYQPLAECGKPVIYLYPTQKEKVSVKLSPVGGFSFAEPAYNSGWNVVADSFSNITNLADGKVYPYLFWEGRGGIYQTPDRGFVVAKAGVHQLLEDKLSLAGLNEKERKDFEEFWEPKMQTAPYYFVTFMGNSVMDGIAPLSITPKPDTIIRILMDFTPLDHPIQVQGFNIRTPERKGFTVVEWGGVLR
jgi:predicted ribosomally synthesized peptide with SipW-like signal peptide